MIFGNSFPRPAMNPTRNWSPTKNDCVLLDSNIIINLAEPNAVFHQEYCDLLEKTIKKYCSDILVPQIIHCEQVSADHGASAFKRNLTALKKYNVKTLPTNEDMIRVSGILCILYKWLRNVEKKKIKLVDMIVGASAAVYEETSKKNTYILTSDRKDFLSPYFVEISDYFFENPHKKQSMYVMLYRVNRLLLNKHWKEFTAKLFEK